MSDLSQIPIGKFSIMTQLSPKALRLYDERGLLKPGEKDPITGYRYYTMSQVEEGIKIKMLTWLGFGLEDISKILAAAEKGDKDLLKDLFSKRLTETQLEIQRLKKIEEVLLDKKKSFEVFYLRTTEPVIKEVPNLGVLSLREIGNYNIVGRMVGELISEIASPENQRNFVKISGPIMYVCYDTEFKEKDADIEIAVPVSGRVTIQSSEIELRKIPGGRVVSILYTGPYGEVGRAYLRAHEFVLKNGYEIRGPTMELYLNNPQETPEEELLTELQIPIK